MKTLERYLQDRRTSSVEDAAFALATLIFSALVVKVLPLMTHVDPVLQILGSALSLAVLVRLLGWFLLWVRSRRIRGSWVYRSSAANWGLARISLTGSTLRYEVQLFETMEGLRSALAGQPIRDGDFLGHTTSTFCEYDDHQVNIRYEVSQASTRYEPRAGFLVLRPAGPEAGHHMVGYWTSTSGTGSGEIYLSRPQRIDEIHHAAEQDR